MKKVIAIAIILIMTVVFSACTKDCETCEATGIVKCSACKGKGTVECEYCQGEKGLNEQCHDCDGNGYIMVKLQDPKECPYCEGKGKIYDSAGALQDYFSGTMTDANDSEYWSECDECNGTGQVTEEEQDCKTCKGSGELDNICSICNGEGYIVCKACKGKGEVKCKECGGTGEL